MDPHVNYYLSKAADNPHRFILSLRLVVICNLNSYASPAQHCPRVSCRANQQHVQRKKHAKVALQQSF
jgi:hypothetical protein